MRELTGWERELAAAEADMTSRELAALSDDPGPVALAALATERERLAAEHDALADAFDDQAAGDQHRAVGRDQRASTRDVTARQPSADLDRAFPDRFAAAVDRDAAVGDRAEAHTDRGRARVHRERARAARQRAATARGRSDKQLALLSEEVAGLQRALQTRNLIGQAQGILMERHHIDAAAAFALLARLSQGANRRLFQVAAEVVAATPAGGDRAVISAPADPSSGELEHPGDLSDMGALSGLDDIGDLTTP